MGSFFDLILIFIFFVLPVISNIIRSTQKRNKARSFKKQQSSGGSTQQQSPTQPQTAQPVRPVVQPEARQATSADSSKADFERRLAEARARVQQSMSDGPDSRQMPQARQERQPARAQMPQPQARQAVPPVQQQSRPQARPQQRSLEVLNPLGGKNAKAKSIESGSLEGRSLEGQSLERPISRSQVRPQRRYTTLSQQQDSKKATSLLLGGLSKKSTAKHGRKSITDSEKLLTMDDKSIMRGLVWKQILDTPKSKKRIAGPSERYQIPSLET